MKNTGVLRRFSWLVVAVACAAAWGSAAELVLSTSGPTVSLGYATYEGYYNGTYDLNIWKRYGRCLIFFRYGMAACILSLACAV